MLKTALLLEIEMEHAHTPVVSRAHEPLWRHMDRAHRRLIRLEFEHELAAPNRVHTHSAVAAARDGHIRNGRECVDKAPPLPTPPSTPPLACSRIMCIDRSDMRGSRTWTQPSAPELSTSSRAN